jgi:hypothetical protein
VAKIFELIAGAKEPVKVPPAEPLKEAEASAPTEERFEPDRNFKKDFKSKL